MPGLEGTDAGAMPGTRIDNDERPAQRIDSDALGRNDAYQGIVDRPLEGTAINEKLGLVIEHVRRSLGQVLAILVAALAHHVPEQHGALRRIDHVINGWGKRPERGQGGRPLAGLGWQRFVHAHWTSLGMLIPSSTSCPHRRAHPPGNRRSVPSACNRASESISPTIDRFLLARR